MPRPVGSKNKPKTFEASSSNSTDNNGKSVRLRARVNVLDVINQARQAEGLGKVKTKEPKVKVGLKLNDDQKRKIALSVSSKLYPGLYSNDFVLTKEMKEKLVKAVNAEIDKIESGDKPLPENF